jgi:hypothetical protein
VERTTANHDLKLGVEARPNGHPPTDWNSAPNAHRSPFISTTPSSSLARTRQDLGMPYLQWSRHGDVDWSRWMTCTLTFDQSGVGGGRTGSEGSFFPTVASYLLHLTNKFIGLCPTSSQPARLGRGDHSKSCRYAMDTVNCQPYRSPLRHSQSEPPEMRVHHHSLQAGIEGPKGMLMAEQGRC